MYGQGEGGGLGTASGVEGSDVCVTLYFEGVYTIEAFLGRNWFI